jgi:hypothetical protein
MGKHNKGGRLSVAHDEESLLINANHNHSAFIDIVNKYQYRGITIHKTALPKLIKALINIYETEKAKVKRG